MCVSCGCGKPNDDHGDRRNITMQDLEDAAQAAGTTRDQVVQNIASGMQQGMGQQSGSGWGRSDYTQQQGSGYGYPSQGRIQDNPRRSQSGYDQPEGGSYGQRENDF